MTELASGFGPGHNLDEFWAVRTDRSAERELMLARVAEEYVARVGTFDWKDSMAKVLDRSMDTIPGLIREAREAGILTRTSQGKAGGSLTLKGARLLGRGQTAWESATPEQQATSARRAAEREDAYRRFKAREIDIDERDRLMKESFRD